MAIYHLSVKAISRSAGRSATGAAAYRAGCKIKDVRTGTVFDFTRKRGIISTHIVLPENTGDWAKDREKLWNAAELAEKRKDACVAREFEVALPIELSVIQREKLVLKFAQIMCDNEQCAVDIAIHQPNKSGDNRNYHAHIMRTTRKVEFEQLTDKLDTEKAGRKRVDDLNHYREMWSNLVNDALKENNINDKVDHRSLEAQGITRLPTVHIGPTATAIERKTKKKSEKRRNYEAKENSHTTLVNDYDDQLKTLNENINLLQQQVSARKAAKAEAEKIRQEEVKKEKQKALKEKLKQEFLEKDAHYLLSFVNHEKFNRIALVGYIANDKNDPILIEGYTIRDLSNINHVVYWNDATDEIAFTVKSREIIVNTNNEDDILAALICADKKFGAFKIIGDDDFKRICAEFAAQHGFKITNPEINAMIDDIKKSSTAGDDFNQQYLNDDGNNLNL